MKDINNRVYHFRGIGGDKLNALYNNAFCLFYPSGYEGFGILIAEAMKAGCPVVCTNISCIPEVAGDAGLLINEVNLEKFVKEIKRLEDVELRNKLITKGFEQSQKFTWDKSFEETHKFYKKAWNRKFK